MSIFAFFGKNKDAKDRETHLCVYDIHELEYLVVDNTFFNRNFKYVGWIYAFGTEAECQAESDYLNGVE